MAPAAGMRCASSQYEFYKADATGTLTMQLSVFRVPCSVFRVPCSVFRVPCSVFRVPCSVFRVPCSVFRVPCSVFRVPCSVFRVPCSALRVPCLVLVLGFDPDQDAGLTSPSWGVSQPPPKRRPGPREARKIGLRSPRGCPAAACKQAWRAAPHMDEPRLPEVFAMGGKASGETPHCFARSATRRGFG